MKKRLAVVHWFPLEQYPPATNLLTYFASEDDWQVHAYSCHNDRDLVPYEHPHVSVRRWTFPSRSLHRVRRYAAYLAFPVCVFLRLLWLRPTILLYIEPHSALPAFLYCLFARRCRLFIHCHEYHDAEEFLQPGMRLVRVYHWLEKRFLYRRARWISQTNEDRLRMFAEDFSPLPTAKLAILPNYPPHSWNEGERAAWRRCRNQSLKLVYVGSVSLHDTFIQPLVGWVNDCGDDVCLDIYSYNNDVDTYRFLRESESDSVRFHEHGVAYQDIPGLLIDYHVGLILYRANTRNYIYNASNKLFEYLAIGLDVWYPPPMLGVQPYANNTSWPRVLETDFENLTQIDLQDRRDRSHLAAARVTYGCEDALRPLRESMAAGVEN